MHAYTIYGICSLQFVPEDGVKQAQMAVLDKLTVSGYNSCTGAYGSRLLNKYYTGPVMTLRANGGTGASSDFYSDISGNLKTGYGGTGTTLSSWLTTQGGQTTYAFVSKWYDQSVTCTNHGTQTTTSSQPIYDVAKKIINFGYTGSSFGIVSPQTNCFMNIPDKSIPYGTSSYTVTMKHMYTSNNVNGGWLGGGIDAYGPTRDPTNTQNNFRYDTTTYNNYWYGNDITTGTFTIGNIVTFKYDNTTTGTTLYQNGISTPTINRTGRTGDNYTYNRIGSTTYSEYLNGQMYYLYMFNSALSDADRIIIEATTYT